MNFKVEAKSLLAAWSKVLPAVPSVPRWLGGNAGIRLSLTKDALTLQAAEGDFSIQHTINVDGSESGEVVLPAFIVKDLLSSRPKDASVTLFATENAVRFSSSDGLSAVLRTLPNEMPVPGAELAGTQAIALNFSDFRNAALAGIKASSGDKSPRHELSGVMLDVSEGVLTAVGIEHTGSFAIFGTCKAQPGDFSAQINVPMQTIQAVAKLDCDVIYVRANEYHVEFQTPDTTITSRVIQGAYPDFKQRMLPLGQQAPYSVVVETDELVQGIKSVSAVIGDNPTVRVAYNDIHMVIEAEYEDSAVYNVELSDDSDFAGLAQLLNQRYLLDVLSVIKDDTVELRFSAPNEPLFIYGASVIGCVAAKAQK